MTEPDRVHIFAYLDYRRYLRDLYAAKKSQGTGFSYRAFSRRAGLRSTNYLHLVMQGERNLSPEMAIRFAKGCGLQHRDADYFCELVAFTQSKSAAEREHVYRRLSQYDGFRRIHQLAEAQAAYHAEWFMPAIRELAAREDFDADPAWVARTLDPPITTAEARRALSVLVELGLLASDVDGRLRPAEPLVTTGSGPLGHHIVNYHRAMLTRAAEALDRVPREEREISSITVCVSQEAMLRLKERVRAFRRELLQLAELEGGPERVVQINFQLFPLSKRKD